MDSIDLYLVGARKNVIADIRNSAKARHFMHQNFNWPADADLDAIEKHTDRLVNEWFLAGNVTPGYAYDTIREAYRVGILIEGKKSGAVYPNRPVNPLLENLTKEMDAIRQARDEYKSRLDAQAHDLDMYHRLIAKINAENRGLRRKLHRAQRELQAACADARVDLDDPNLFIVRPSRMMELRLLGRLTQDVTRIVFEIPSEAEYGRMLQKDEQNYYDRRNTSLWWKGLRKNLLRACKPNLRGSKRGTVRIIQWISVFATEISKQEVANHNRAYTDTRRNMRAAKSRYIW